MSETVLRSLDDIRKETFEAAVPGTFQLEVADGQTVVAELVQYKLRIDTAMQECFSLLFKVPDDVPVEQRIYRLTHAELGTLELFLVPVKRNDQGLFFEAVFNRLLN